MQIERELALELRVQELENIILSVKEGLIKEKALFPSHLWEYLNLKPADPTPPIEATPEQYAEFERMPDEPDDAPDEKLDAKRLRALNKS